MQGASPLASPGLGGARHGLNLRSKHPAGASPRRWRLDQPLRCPTGGLPCLSPANPAFSLLFCPHPPNPLPLRGRGRPRLLHARGFAPCIPGAGRGAARAEPAEQAPGGGRPPRRWWLDQPLRCPAGACLLCRLPTFLLACFSAPIPPPRARRALFPAGRGKPRLFHARGFAPCIPGTGWDAAQVEPAEQAPGGGRTPGVGGSASHCGIRRGLALLAAYRPCR